MDIFIFSESYGGATAKKGVYVTPYPSIVTEIVAPPVARSSIDCSSINGSCNFLQNINFTPTIPYDPTDPFTRNQIPYWVATHGTPQIHNPWPPGTQPPSPATGFAYMYGTAPFFPGGPHTGEGIAQKIPALNTATNYTMSFFIKFIPWLSDPATQIDEFYIVLVYCSDVDAFPTGTNNIPALPINSQVVYSGSAITNTSWQQIQFSFTANDNYNMVWIFPKQQNYNAGAGFAYPVLTTTNTASSISPAGPITYYNHYETATSLTLTSSQASSYQWYKNDIPISGATNQTYSIDVSGWTNYTAYYKCLTSCGISNVVTFNYLVCYEYGDYPVGIPSNQCYSALPLTLNAVNLGTGTTYSWWEEYNPTCFTFFNFSGNTCQFTTSGCSYSARIYTKSSKNGEEVYMNYNIGINQYCKTTYLHYSEDASITKQNSTMIFPNPSNNLVTISSTTRINKVEIYSSAGLLIRQKNGSNQNQLTMSISDIPAGIYTCKVYSGTAFETLKLVVQRQ